MRQVKLKILSNQKIADGHYVIRLAGPQLARLAEPGQFVQIMTQESDEPFLPRPFSFLDARKGMIEILFQVVGRGTQILSQKKKGEKLKVLGPLGNGFTWSKRKLSNQEFILVGGGVGIPPLYHLAATLMRNKQNGFKPKNIRVFLGARIKTFLHCERDFKKWGIPVTVATDNGSKGYRGLITEPLEVYLESLNGQKTSLYACGPTPMLKAVSDLVRKYEVPCQVSVEEPMPCGFGVCLGCAVKHSAKGKDAVGTDKQSRPFRYAMSCTEGPVFDSRNILWD